MSTITLPKGKKALSTKEFQEGKHKEPDMNENTPENKDMLPAQTQAHEQAKSLLPISINTYVSSLTNAMISSRYALQIELSVGLSVFFERGSADREAKKLLYSIYHKAGWKCDTPEAENYKTVNRRINSSAALFTTLGAARIGEMIGGNAEIQAINAIVKGIEPLQLNSVDAVLAYCGKPRIAAKPQHAPAVEQKKEPVAERQADKKQEGEPEGNVPKANAEQQLEPGEIVLPEEPEGKAEDHAEKELPDDIQGPRWMRRVGDIEGATHLDSPSVHIIIAPNASKDELTKIAKQLMALAEAMNGQHKGKTSVKEKEHEPEGMLQAELRKIPEPMKRRGRKVITR